MGRSFQTRKIVDRLGLERLMELVGLDRLVLSASTVKAACPRCSPAAVSSFLRAPRLLQRPRNRRSVVLHQFELGFSDASLFGGFGSLIGRLFGRLGNLPARGRDSNGLLAL